jgi:hypothetical protein
MEEETKQATLAKLILKGGKGTVPEREVLCTLCGRTWKDGSAKLARKHITDHHSLPVICQFTGQVFGKEENTTYTLVTEVTGQTLPNFTRLAESAVTNVTTIAIADTQNTIDNTKRSTHSNQTKAARKDQDPTSPATLSDS